MAITSQPVIPDKARDLWERASAWRARLPDIHAGRLELKGNALNRSWRSDETAAAMRGRACRTSAVAIILDANGLNASYGGGGLLHSPHIIGFCAGFPADKDTLAVPAINGFLIFTTLGALLPVDVDHAAPLILDTARSAVAACCAVTRPAERYPGDRSFVTVNTDAVCSACQHWLDNADARQERRHAKPHTTGTPG
ncbi:hypothetical protein GCM10010358_68120 [Streptomyces minutiscleroticus]|uniref:Uncharacterized protein n=1 Tax=Streptomyces minutiscleroticus TaxID=68238 RepID=A0A918NXY4_9ACTN|nr:hypothetical protein [Streptomyces minutiscleroticus]GGY05110.1 hypothetical protein GCM10010358_68120 [Streptomyces minutiscleroticus]